MLIANNFSTATVFDFVLQALFSCFSISKSGQQANPVGNRDRFSQKNLQISFMQLMLMSVETIFCIY